MNSIPPYHQYSQISRPSTIAELAARARDDLWDEKRELKYYLRVAEKYRREAKNFLESGDLESAFIEFAKAATLVLEKIPTHREYNTLLNYGQRDNLSMNGQEILDNLANLKPILVDRYEKWESQHPETYDRNYAPDAQQLYQISNTPSRRPEEDRRSRSRDREVTQPQINEEVVLWRKQREEQMRRDEEDSAQGRGSQRDRRRDAEIAARNAAGELDQADTRRQRGDLERQIQEAERQQQAEVERQKQADNHQRQQERRLREEIKRKRKRKEEQEGILRRQQEAEDAARQTRQQITVNNAPHSVPYPTPPAPYMYSTYPTTSTTVMPNAATNPYYPRPPPPRRHSMTLKSQPPSVYIPADDPTDDEDDSTDSEPAPRIHIRRTGQHEQVIDNSKTPTRAAPTNHSYPPPITTTSPPPVEGGRMMYPQLMSTHQKMQGYYPSLNSIMFTHQQQQQQRQYSYSGPPRPPPIPAPPHAPPSFLKTVNMPRECLPRFLAIAKVNTAMNLETCGLLLGKNKGTKYVVTTLLIPKQHGTSDTCTMDEEELVFQFTEERSLITLGWIHTHPSQSCFMSSLDLHTHVGFQRMLPESFAVVCAPKSTPNFGIFRLTDPPGLKTVLECNATGAFHPHPDIPIYTDADKGHIQLKDISIEIVDLRSPQLYGEMEERPGLGLLIHLLKMNDTSIRI